MKRRPRRGVRPARGSRPWLSLGLLLLACAGDEEPVPAVDPMPGPDASEESEDRAGVAPALIDSSYAPAVAGEEGWEYVRAAEADLDADGEAEKVVLTARAALVAGKPAWDDGQPWQLYVEEADGSRTYAYSRYVQLGMLEALLTSSPPTVLLVEHVPDGFTVYEIRYGGPGDLEAIRRLHRRLDPVRGFAAPPYTSQRVR